MSLKDSLIPFIFDGLPVRGALVQLEASWQRMHVGHDYAPAVLDVLGHAAASSVMIAHSLKINGHTTMQISGDGPLSMLVMQCTSALELRGMATAGAETPAASYAELLGDACCAITIDGEDMERPYQGIVDVSGDSLGQSLEAYYTRSAQVPTHLALCCDNAISGGLMLQRMPSGGELPEDDWRRLGLLAATLRTADLAGGISTDLLSQLFAGDDLRVFDARAAAFRCRCSRRRVEDVLRMLGPDEAAAAINEAGRIDITCEYCGRRRSFDAADLQQLFAGAGSPGAERIH